MAQILVRELDKAVVERLKELAKESGRSLQSEVKIILGQAANEPKANMKAAREISRKFRSRFKGRKFPDTLELLREDRKR